MKPIAHSIQAKIVLAITATFLAVLLASALLTARSEHRLAETIGTEKAREIARAYFDGLNTLMLTGAMAEKDTWRGKLLAEAGVRELRVVRAPGPWRDAAATPPPQDDLERRALAGEPASRIVEAPDGRAVTHLAPIRASGNHLGANCLSCHAVPGDSVLGAVRVTYSLAALDSELNHNLLVNTAINLGLFGLGIGLLLLMLRAIVVAPLLAIRDAMQRVERDAHLGLRLEIRGGDEIGSLARAINLLLERFRDSLGTLAETAHRLTATAERVARVSEQTAQAADQQRAETETAVRLIGDLRATVQAVGGSAAATAEASAEADRQALLSTASTRETLAGILVLVREIESAAVAMGKLDERSHNVSGVLAVIRDIAEQTNLLALNAAIEAARAGDAGRGFAVVSEEVRKLATLSQTSTHSIKEIVGELQREAREAAGAMGHARDSAETHTRQLGQALSGLDRIAGRVADIRRLTETAADAVAHENELADSVNQRMLAVSAIAGRTSVEAGTTRSVSEELVALARELDALVDRFKLR